MEFCTYVGAFAGVHYEGVAFFVFHYVDEIVVEGVVEGDKLKEVRLSGTEKSGGMLYVLRNQLVDFYQRSYSFCK